MGKYNRKDDEHATDAVARGGSMVRDHLLGKISVRDELIRELVQALRIRDGGLHKEYCSIFRGADVCDCGHKRAHKIISKAEELLSDG